MDTHPVVLVSWNDARAYCDWAGRRLPTEAEFEKCLRGGTAGSRYPWGDGLPPRGKPGNYPDGGPLPRHSAFGTIDGYDDGYERTSPAGSFEQNALGLHDVTGNASEWCSDWFDAKYYGTLGGGAARDPQGPSTGAVRVLRGGSWSNRPILLRCAFRSVSPPEIPYSNIGFRCAIGIP